MEVPQRICCPLVLLKPGLHGRGAQAGPREALILGFYVVLGFYGARCVEEMGLLGGVQEVSTDEFVVPSGLTAL